MKRNSSRFTNPAPLSLSISQALMASTPPPSDNIVIKPPRDKRSYRVLHLPNGLCAVLIHDPEISPDDGNPPDQTPEDVESNISSNSSGGGGEEEEKMGSKKNRGVSETKKAAVALCVGMGSFSDPIEVPGLAHILEHMLFMGSAEFPDENEYDSYLSKHGGSSNAYTSPESTCYHFQVKHEFLKGALERFSQFFISPLVKLEAMEREILAVDSEFSKDLQNDACRLEQLRCHTAVSSHTFNRFTCGNKKTLVDDASENGINIHEQIMHLYNENYYGSLMKLVVIGGESLDVIEDWVVELFSNVRQGPREQIKSEEAQKEVLSIWKAAQKEVLPIWKAGKLYRLQAVKDVNSLELSWTLPCLYNEYLKKPHRYLSQLMGDEGRGSLYFFLKAKGWITSLCSGVADRSFIAFIYTVTIHLTDSGLEKVYEIIGFVYQYIKLIRQVDPQEWIFKEIQDLANIAFIFAEEQPQAGFAVELAENLLLYPEEHIIYGDYALEVWDEALIKRVLSFLTPENMRGDILSKSIGKHSKDVQYEPWYGSQYTEEDISYSLLELWRDPLEVDSSFHLPLKNEFIPSDFSLHCVNSSNSHANAVLPVCIVDKPLIKLWYKLDDTFKVPRASIYFLITMKGGCDDVKSCLLSCLFGILLEDKLNEIAYQAADAMLHTSLSCDGDQLGLTLYGFSDKILVLLSKILTTAKCFLPAEDRFKVMKEAMERASRNANVNPLSHSSYLRYEVLLEKFWDLDDQFSCLVGLTVADLEAFIPQLLSQLYVEGFCHGNLSEEEALNISDIFSLNFPVQPLPLELRHKDRLLCLTPGAYLVRDASVKNKLEQNSVLELYFQIEPDTGTEPTRTSALVDLFGQIVAEPFFNQLRTKEQLGYRVSCGGSTMCRILGYSFCIQSSEYNPMYLHRRVNKFIDSLKELLEGLDNESFENYRSGLIAEKLEKFTSQSYEASYLWSQIASKRYCFKMWEKEAEELKSISKNDVIDWYNTYLKPTSQKCRRLATHVWGSNTNIMDEETPMKSAKTIENIRSFKMSSEFYPSAC
ncbi:hypothetical protein GIB67_040994 [Kingdonia uniflora]|uniref:Nardilysin n=1 Tax=Kingdonia uniflora TaxID=39325 RepID=A0A7J7NCP8_9MAGN|nr:hypothetical protein GIB67_040994 [Kingdonia uniflora]